MNHADTLSLEFMLRVCRAYWRGGEMLWKVELKESGSLDGSSPFRYLGYT